MSESLTVDWKALHGDRFRGARVLVTGGAGFIGSHLSETLWKLGAEVVVIDDLSGGSRDNLTSFGPVEFHAGSILDRDLLASCTRGCRYVFHQAALGSVPRSVEQPRLYNDVNTTGTLNVLEAAREAKVSRVIFAASSSAYGSNPVPFASALLKGRQPVIYGDGVQSRDFTFVANAVQANLLAATNDKPLAGEVINVGCGSRISVNELAAAMAAALGRPDLEPVYEPVRAGDILHSFADLQRAAGLLAYKPIIDFQPGLEQTLAWYKSVMTS
jgi:UDP-glucose 4-epimerase